MGPIMEVPHAAMFVRNLATHYQNIFHVRILVHLL